MHYPPPDLLLPWLPIADDSVAQRLCHLGWSFDSRTRRNRLRRHALLCTALHAGVVPRPMHVHADDQGLHYQEGLDVDHWPATLHDQAASLAGTAEVLALALAIGRILQSLECAGIVHGRLTPERVLWEPASARAWLIDFDRGGFIYAADDALPARASSAGGDLAALGGLLAWRVSGDRAWLRHAQQVGAAPAAQALDALPIDPFLGLVMRSLLQAGGSGGYRSARALCEELVGGVARPRPAGLGRPVGWRLPMERIGRSDEATQILQAFAAVDRRSAAPTPYRLAHQALVVVDGCSGIGKTSVVQATCQAMREHGARVAVGKFNQYGSQPPVAALLDALNEALADLTGQDTAPREATAASLRAELGAMAGVLTASLPWLERLIGTQLPAPELGADASRIRFELALRRLVVALSTGEVPLVVFVDDLQWADLRSLELLGGLLSEPRMGRLLLLGAFRSEAVDEDHPLRSWLARMGADATVDLRRIPMNAWTEDDIGALLAAAGIRRSEALAQAARQLVGLTGGNPFMTLQLLRAAEQARVIEPDNEGWQVDPARLDALLDPSGVLGLVQSRLRGLPDAAQAALSDAAHLGAVWSIETLAAGRGSSSLQLCRDLAPALAAGFVLLADDDAAGAQALTFRFQHDVVQQAAHELVAPEQRDALRVRLGSSLLRRAREQGELDPFLFAIVQQFNGVQQSPAGGLDAATSARLNERAGQLASAHGASGDALQYFLRAVRASAMPEAAFADTQAFALYRRAAEAACVAARFEIADELLDRASALGPDALEQARIGELRVLVLLARNRLTDALAVGQATLAALGVPLMALGDPSTWPTVPRAHALNFSQPSPRADCAQRLLVGLTPCAYITSFELYTRVIRTMIELAVQWPASALTPLAWTNYGLTLCGLERRAEAFEASELALSMLDRVADASLRCKVRVLCLGFLRHWRLPLSQQVAPLLQAYDDCQISGDQEYLGYAAFLYADKAFGMQPLNEVIGGHALRTDTVRQFGHDFSYHHCRVWMQGLLALRGDAASQPLQLEGPAFSEAADLALLEAAQNGFSLFTAHTLRAMLAWHRGDIEACWQACRQALSVADNGTGTVLSIELQVLAALSAPAGEGGAFRDRLAGWAQVAPTNLQHKLALVDAVFAARAGRLSDALPQFERARAAAQAGEFLRDQVMIEQACSEALADLGDREAAQRWFGYAWSSGLRWGALSVVERLLARHAQRISELDHAAPPSAAGARPTARAFDLARVSHDMRTPLGGVMGLTKLLLDSELDERQRRLTTLTRVSAESLLGLVNDIMDLGQLEHGGLRLHREPVDLRRLAEQAIELFQVRHRNDRVDLRLRIDDAVPATIDADRQRLGQVINNFLSNAVKFTQHGYIELRLETMGDAGGRSVKVSVEDTGAGISEDEQGPIFSAFYQSRSGTEYHQDASSGMGLAVCKGIIEALGGAIGFRSAAGQGSCFWFVLPLDRSASPA
jgi:predicted ATPase/nitrogen-specific signal transduction histidine kinase